MLYPPSPCCGTLPIAAGISVSKDVAEAIERAAREIYETGSTDVQMDLLRATASQLIGAVKKGYGMGINDVAYNSPDWETLAKITENVYSFSAAKNYHELRDMTDALRDGDRIRSFEEFRKAVEEIDAKYNGNWLRTEYNQAIAASQCGARWNEFKRNAKAMPMLQYQAVMDSNTREDHARLNGVKKRVDDPFWDIYMPPNGWGCRCEVIQLPSSAAKETPSEKIIPPQVPKMFQINFGKRGIAFPAGHAYFKRLPKEYEYKLKETTREEVRRILDNAQEYQRLKADKDYTDVDFDWGNGGLKATHKDHNFDKAKGIYEKDVQKAGFKKGRSVIFGAEKSNVIGERFTEGLWDNCSFEIASCETVTENNILRGLKHCASKKTTEIAVLHYPNGGFDQEILKKALKRYNGLAKLNDGQYLKFSRIICVDSDRIVFEMDI